MKKAEFEKPAKLKPAMLKPAKLKPAKLKAAKLKAASTTSQAAAAGWAAQEPPGVGPGEEEEETSTLPVPACRPEWPPGSDQSSLRGPCFLLHPQSPDFSLH